MKTTLLIMAAGIGSRFGGGIKQLAPVGLNGEIIIDYSIHDAIKACKIPTIEVHMSNIFSREEWRKKSVISSASIGIISGFGLLSYKLALLYISLK